MMNGPFPAPERMQPPAPVPPSWEQSRPHHGKSSKRVSVAAQSAAAAAAAAAAAIVAGGATSPSTADRRDDVSNKGTPQEQTMGESRQPQESVTPTRPAAPSPSVSRRGVAPEEIPEALLHDERLRTSESYYYTQGPDVNSVVFERVFLEDLAEREVAYQLRRSVDKIASRFVRVRLEGLRESLGYLTAFATEASVEVVAKTYSVEESRGGGGAVIAGGGAAALASNTIRPYDAIRAELLPSSYVAGAVAPSSPQPGGAAAAVVSPSSSSSPGKPMQVRSVCWDRVQRALRCVDLSAPLATYVLVLRTDTRGMMNRGLPVRVELTDEEALAWGQPTPTAAAPASAAAAVGSTSEPSTTLLDSIVGVSWQERLLALRVIQGLSLTIYHQRRCISDGFLFHYAAEQMQCFLQHVEARHRLAHRKAVESASWASHGATTSTSSVVVSSVGSHGATHATNTRVVDMDDDIIATLIALVEAVEAACHYNSASLSRLVQAGGVVALMNVVYCPYAPFDLRASILDSMSVLLQEVAPFRRMVASVAHVGEAGGAAPEQDEALGVMLHRAVHGYTDAGALNQGGGTASGNGQLGMRKPVSAGPPPYGLDRASASKFDSALREWLSQHGLSHVVSGVLRLRDVAEAAMTEPSDPAERARLQRMKQKREKRIQDLLLAIDGRRAELD